MMEHYFFPRPISTGAITMTTSGIIFVLAGLVLLFTLGLTILNMILTIAGFVQLFLGIRSMYLIKKSNPGDEDYDHWLEQQVQAMKPRAMRLLNLNQSQVTSQILCTHSIILPGSSLAKNYHDDVLIKQGKDGQWRTSVNLYTYFFPTDHFIAMCTCDVNACRQTISSEYQTEEYFYRDIISTSFSSFQDTAEIAGMKYPYRVQQLSFRISNGDDIRLGAHLSAMPLDRGQGAPIILLPDTHINQTLADLRGLLRSKKQRSR